MEKQPDPNCVSCPLIASAREEVDHLLACSSRDQVSYQNEIDWLKQRIEELEDQLFVMVEFKPAIIDEEGDLPF
jgi:hypothetical protein